MNPASSWPKAEVAVALGSQANWARRYVELCNGSLGLKCWDALGKGGRLGQGDDRVMSWQCHSSVIGPVDPQATPGLPADHWQRAQVHNLQIQKPGGHSLAGLLQGWDGAVSWVACGILQQCKLVRFC